MFKSGNKIGVDFILKFYQVAFFCIAKLLLSIIRNINLKERRFNNFQRFILKSVMIALFMSDIVGK